MSLHTPPATDPVGGPGYERRDVNLRAIVYLALAVAVLVGGTMAGLRWLIGVYEMQAQRADPSASPLALDQTPPAPRLQNTPNRDYQEYLAAQHAQLETYGWLDKQQGVVRLPIDRAMELALERGLRQAQRDPTREEEVESKTTEDR